MNATPTALPGAEDALRRDITRAIEIAVVEKTMHHPVKKYWEQLRWLWPHVADAILALQSPRASDEVLAPAAIPKGMKAWHGGDRAPADWDGGEVLHRNGILGRTWDKPARWVHAKSSNLSLRDSCTWMNPASDIIAYTPKPASDEVPAHATVQQDRPRTAAHSTSTDNSELEPDDRQDRTNQGTDRQGSAGGEIGGCTSVLAGGVQRGERDVRCEYGGQDRLRDGAGASEVPANPVGEGLLTHAEAGELGAYRHGIDWRDNSIEAVAARKARHAELESRAALTNRTGEASDEVPGEASDVCAVPPAGWRCTRKPGHEGPCAALPTGGGA